MTASGAGSSRSACEAAALEAEDLVWRRQQPREEQDRRAAARAEAAALAEAERQAAAAALGVLPCEDCGQEQAAGLCEVCGYRRRTEALKVEAGMVAAAWSADLDDSQAVAAVLVHVRETLQVAARKAVDDFLGSAEPGVLDGDPLGTASVLAFGVLQAVQDAARSTAAARHHPGASGTGRRLSTIRLTI